jgi:hypothetical protein
MDDYDPDPPPADPLPELGLPRSPLLERGPAGPMSRGPVVTEPVFPGATGRLVEPIMSSSWGRKPGPVLP